MGVPVLRSLTSDCSAEERRHVVATATPTVVAVFVVSALGGEARLRWTGTSLGLFRFGDGIVLLLMALAMLLAEVGRVRARPQETRALRVVPRSQWCHWRSRYLRVGVRAAGPVAHRPGNTGLNILNRVFGPILAATAVEVIANGLRQLFPVLAGGWPVPRLGMQPCDADISTGRAGVTSGPERQDRRSRRC